MVSTDLDRTLRRLRARIKHLVRSPIAVVPSRTKQLLAWIEARPLLAATLATIAASEREFAAKISDALTVDHTYASPFSAQEPAQPLQPSTPDDAAALALASLRVVAQLPPLDSRFQTLGDEDVNQIRARYSRLNHYLLGDFRKEDSSFVDGVRQVALPNLLAFIEDSVDQHGAVLALLRKYKHRCEWYRRHRLRALLNANPERQRKGEDVLTFDLYEYLHDQGHAFSIESRTASGRPDLLLDQGGGLRVVADGKLITEARRARTQLKKGFRQVLDYCQEHSLPVGYLVVFVLEDIKISVEGEDDYGFSCLRAAGTTVYYVIVDLAYHESSASVRPPPRVLSLSVADVQAPTPDEEAEP